MHNETKSKPVDINRRRLAKTGLATPIVLASLVSKNALASPAYKCTISGQLSGNFSPAGHGSENDSCALGPTVTTLQGGSGWGNVNKDAAFSSVFNINPYYSRNAANLGGLLRKAGGAQVASLNHVMTINSVTNNNAPHDVPLARAAIAAYVGFIDKGADYPLTLLQIQQMFDYAFRGVDYPFPGPSITPTKANLSRDEVFDYFTFLTNNVKPTIAA